MTTRTPTDRRLEARAQPAADSDDSALIKLFLERVWAEQGLARSTLGSYGRDLDGLARWLHPRGTPLLAVQRQDLFDYLAERSARQYASRSNARLLSSLRAFYSQQLRIGAIDQDPTALLDSPKLGRSLPKALSESEVEALIKASDIDTPAGLRDRAMVELMYAAGLRVSELVNLPSAAVNLRQGVLRVMGKGGKERLVPMGEEAQHWLERYLAEGRPALVGKRDIVPAVRRAGWGADDPATVLGPGQDAGNQAPASMPPRSVRMACVTVLPPICSTMAPTCARCRCCSGIRACRPPRSTPSWPGKG